MKRLISLLKLGFVLQQERGQILDGVRRSAGNKAKKSCEVKKQKPKEDQQIH